MLYQGFDEKAHTSQLLSVVTDPVCNIIVTLLIQSENDSPPTGERMPQKEVSDHSCFLFISRVVSRLEFSQLVRTDAKDGFIVDINFEQVHSSELLYYAIDSESCSIGGRTAKEHA